MGERSDSSSGVIDVPVPAIDAQPNWLLLPTVAVPTLIPLLAKVALVVRTLPSTSFLFFLRLSSSSMSPDPES